MNTLGKVFGTLILFLIVLSLFFGWPLHWNGWMPFQNLDQAASQVAGRIQVQSDPTPATAVVLGQPLQPRDEVVYAGDARPKAWVPDNEQNGAPICEWGIPSGTVLDRNWPTKLTNCVSFNLQEGSAQEVNWIYGQEDYQFLLEDWDNNANTQHKGAGWWGPLDRPDVYVMVWYGDQADPCVGTSFEIQPNVTIRAKFLNEGTVPGVWSQGATLTYDPECRAP